MLIMMPFLIYAGAGRLLLTPDGKRNIIKMSQLQEIILHTGPIAGLITYNSSKEV